MSLFSLTQNNLSSNTNNLEQYTANTNGNQICRALSEDRRVENMGPNEQALPGCLLASELKAPRRG